MKSGVIVEAAPAARHSKVLLLCCIQQASCAQTCQLDLILLSGPNELHDPGQGRMQRPITSSEGHIPFSGLRRGMNKNKCLLKHQIAGQPYINLCVSTPSLLRQVAL